MNTIPLPFHLFIHFILAISVGYFCGRHFKQIKLGVIIGFIGGFLIDLDHVLEYLLFFNWHFDLFEFISGRQFLLSDQIHLWFHAWEYIIILLLGTWIFKKSKTAQLILFTLALAMSVHILSDSVINNFPLKYYSLSYRAEMNFAAEKLLSPQEYLENLELKRELGY